MNKKEFNRKKGKYIKNLGKVSAIVSAVALTLDMVLKTIQSKSNKGQKKIREAR